MLGRALKSATVLFLIGCLETPARAQNLEAGKSPSQIFSGTCSACHRSPRGLLKTVPPGSLSGFLRQHYTTGSEMASLLSGYLVSNGATDPRGGGLTRQGREAQEGRPAAAPGEIDPRTGRRVRPAADPQQAARPEIDAPPGAASSRPARNAKRAPQAEVDRPADAAGIDPSQAPAGERGPAARQKLGTKGRPIREEAPKTEPLKETTKDQPAAPSEAAGTDPGKAEETKADAAKPAQTETAAPEAARSGSVQPEASKSDGPAEAASEGAATGEASRPIPLRADPVPPVTPAPKTPEGDTPIQTVTPTPSSPEPAVRSDPATDNSGGSAPVVSATPAEPPAPLPAPALSAPPPPPVIAPSSVTASSPAGPPAPPISR